MTFSGSWVCVEGGDGAGKSTQLRLLANRVAASGTEVVETFEPGGTELGAELRKLVLDPDRTVDCYTEALIMAADRAAHYQQVVKPALQRGACVIASRGWFSSLAYQGVGRGLGVDVVHQLSLFALRGRLPDVVVVLDLPGGQAIARVAERGDTDRLERDVIQQRIPAAYSMLAERFDDRCVRVDASGTPAEIHERVWEALSAWASRRTPTQ